MWPPLAAGPCREREEPHRAYSQNGIRSHALISAEQTRPIHPRRCRKLASKKLRWPVFRQGAPAHWQTRRRRPPRNARDLLIGKHAATDRPATQLAADRPATQLLLDGRRACLIGKNAAATDRPATRAQRNYFFSPQTAPAAAHKSSSRPLQKRARVENTPPAAALQLPVAHPPCGSPGGRAHRPRPELRTLGLASNTPRRRPLKLWPSIDILGPLMMRMHAHIDCDGLTELSAGRRAR